MIGQREIHPTRRLHVLLVKDGHADQMERRLIPGKTVDDADDRIEILPRLLFRNPIPSNDLFHGPLRNLFFRDLVTTLDHRLEDKTRGVVQEQHVFTVDPQLVLIRSQMKPDAVQGDMFQHTRISRFIKHLSFKTFDTSRCTTLKIISLCCKKKVFSR